ncbi:MAG: hypothetical protein LJU34_00485 [Oscillospiraceae bacterium]|nr:hypothetical protein [Oscillospiraceae bacterium]
MKQQKNVFRGLLVLVIIFVVFSVIAFALPLTMNGVFWLAYLFAVVSIAVQGYALYAGFIKGDNAHSRLYGFPIARIGTVYMVAQLILSLVYMLLGTIIPVWVVIILCVVALALTLIGLIASDAVREEIQRQDTVLKKDVKTMRALQSKVRVIAGQCNDADVAQEVSAFSEALQYSDPVSSDSLADIEDSLAALVDDLEKAVLDADYVAASELCRKASAVLTERNRLCKLNK